MCRIWLAKGRISVHKRGYTYIYVKGEEGKELTKCRGKDVVLIVVVKDESSQDTCD